MVRVQLLILLLLLIGNLGLAQNQPCSVDLPVGIVGTDGSLLSGLTAQDISVHWHKQTLHVDTINYDTGPRRVLFLLDTSRRLAPEARKAETMLVNYVLSHARPSDSFALMTVRGVLRRVHFEEGHDTLAKALEELAADPKEQQKAMNVLDSIMEGVHWFGEPRLGDAILIIADHLEELNEERQYQSRQLSHTGPWDGVASDRGPSFEAPSHFKFSAVTDALTDHQIRVFGLQLGAMKVAPLNAVYVPNEENLFGITTASGGYAVLDPADPFGAYVMNDARGQSLQRKVFQLYGAICQFYILRMHTQPPIHHELWNLELAKDLQKNTRALYPRWFNPCRTEKPN